MKYQIETELPTDFQDAGQWRSWTLEASGNNVDELLKSAQISEIDQWGGEINSYPLEDAPNDVQRDADRMIRAKVSDHWDQDATIDVCIEPDCDPGVNPIGDDDKCPACGKLEPKCEQVNAIYWESTRGPK